MIKIFRGKSAYEMAFSRQKALEKITQEAETYSDHLIKCILFKNTTGNLWHWVDELSTKLSNVNKIKLKSGGKFNEQLYLDEFLLADGDCEEDFKLTLEQFKRKYRFKYSEFEITPALITLTNTVFNEIANYFAPVLASLNAHAIEWFRDILLDYFEVHL